jgi:outer membrane protein assembly factor BamB
VLVGGKLFLASSIGEAVVVNPATGAVEKTLRLGAPVYIPPVVAGGKVYLLTDEGKLVALQ